jgi:Flp pilus assembly protein TadD
MTEALAKTKSQLNPKGGTLMTARRILFTIFILLTFFSFSYAGELFSEEARNAYNQGVAAQRKGNFDEASACYKRVNLLVGDADDTYWRLILHNVAVMHALRGDLDSAESLLLDLLKENPKDEKVIQNLAVLYNRRGDSKKALEYCSKPSKSPDKFLMEQEVEK